MKKINNIQQLKAREKSLLKEQASLEEKLRDDWTKLAALLKTGQPAKVGSETPGLIHGLVKSGLRYGVELLAGKLSGRAFRALDKIL